MQNFSELNLSAPLMRALGDLGFEKPSPIQIEALPVLLGPPTDFLGLAATGTGKTAAFGIPLLERLNPEIRAVQALVVCPTRELALQVAGQIELLGKHLNVRALPIFGGADYGAQIQGLKRGATVVVGTPGRLIDHLDRGTLKLDQLQMVVLDEADEMISMGFREDMERLMEGAPRETCQRWMFSATMSANVRTVADEFLQSPKMVQVNRREMLSATVEQYYYMTQEKNKSEVLCKLIDAADDFYGVVFCQTKLLVTNLQGFLADRGFKVDSLHGDKTQAAREQTLKAFREKRVRVLICTDVAARGLDIKDITHVINYSIPRELDNYVHRIGRTARSGKNGLALSLVTPSHRHLLGKIERLTKSRILEGVIPTRKAIGLKKVSSLLAKFDDQKFAERATDLLDSAWRDRLATMSLEEVAGRFITMMYPEIFNDDAERPKLPPRDMDEGRGFEKRGFEKRGYGSRDAVESRGFEKRGYETRGFEKRGYDKPNFEKRTFDKPAPVEKAFEPEAKSNFGAREATSVPSASTPARAGAQGTLPADVASASEARPTFKKPAAKKAAFDRPFDKAGFEKRTSASGGYEKRSYGKKPFAKGAGAKRGFDETDGDKPFYAKPFAKRGPAKGAFEKREFNPTTGESRTFGTRGGEGSERTGRPGFHARLEGAKPFFKKRFAKDDGDAGGGGARKVRPKWAPTAGKNGGNAPPRRKTKAEGR